MQIKIGRVGDYLTVQVEYESAVIDLGTFHNKSYNFELANLSDNLKTAAKTIDDFLAERSDNLTNES